MMETATVQTSFPSHPACKESGVGWIDVIPTHWEIRPGLNFLMESRDKNTGMKRSVVLSLSYGRIRVKAEDELTGLVPESFETYQLVEKGDLIFRPTDLQNDKTSLRSSISEFEGIITSAYLNIRCKSHADSKYYHYLFRAIDNNKIIYGLGSGLRQNIDFRDFRRFSFPFPPKKEQSAIAAFLDEKTAKIDALIALKERMIALLKECRQIIIQQAVTKGLDPNAKMKPSGVEWIGEIPEGWEVNQVKRIGKTVSGSTPSSGQRERYYNGYLPWVRTTDLNNGTLKDVPERITDKALKETACKKVPYGTVCIAMYGGEGTIGKHAILEFEGTLNQALCGVYDLKGILPRYFFFYIKSIRPYWMHVANGTRKDPNIGQDDVRNLHVCYPNREEQNEILKHIDRYSEVIEASIALHERQIEKLKEYRSVLIDSAVTGKIKVG
jgi:type I restriction enzyme, S subunit